MAVYNLAGQGPAHDAVEARVELTKCDAAMCAFGSGTYAWLTGTMQLPVGTQQNDVGLRPWPLALLC